jgi:hypothetical protein
VSEREDAIRQRAHEISQSDEAGTPEENWLRAERELGEGGTEGEPWAKFSSGRDPHDDQSG